MITLEFDPISLVIEAANHLYPEAEAKIVWTTDLDGGDGSEEWYGVTVFPDDGSTPTIVINLETPMEGVAEVIAHEIAHIVAGEPAGHGKVWDEAFEAIQNEYATRFLAIAQAAGCDVTVHEG
jgi:hypothetical protein